MNVIAAIVAANRSGKHVGLPSWCTAHPETLAAILSTYRHDTAPVLIEATCNQVNQYGGYTGMTPPAFRRFVEAIAGTEGVDPARLVLGGDHLGPNPWRREPAGQAMAKARVMVADYVAAGFSKIHLDASMACADDGTLAQSTMASRAAELAEVAEHTAMRCGLPQPCYVIGTEVPVPGGEVAGSGAVQVTRPEAAAQVYALHRDAFAARGLGAAFGRAVALVVQPGVDFSNHDVLAFDPAGAAGLSAAISTLPGMVYEAHSTDYQTGAALAALVAGHFAILKVGPELTWAYARAIEELAIEELAIEELAIEELAVEELAIEELAVEELATAERGAARPSRILDVVRAEMTADPQHWQGYLAPGDDLVAGLSDRVRYYWPRPAIGAALGQLAANLGPTAVRATVVAHVGAVVAKYRKASGDPAG